MLETIIRRLLTYLGDHMGFDYDDLQNSVGLTAIQVLTCKEIMEDVL